MCPNGVYAAGFVEKILYIKVDSNTVSFFDVKVGVKYIVYNNMYKFNTQIDRQSFILQDGNTIFLCVIIGEIDHFNIVLL